MARRFLIKYLLRFFLFDGGTLDFGANFETILRRKKKCKIIISSESTVVSNDLPGGWKSTVERCQYPTTELLRFTKILKILVLVMYVQINYLVFPKTRPDRIRWYNHRLYKLLLNYINIICGTMSFRTHVVSIINFVITKNVIIFPKKTDDSNSKNTSQ